jgi:hypothetical protein
MPQPTSSTDPLGPDAAQPGSGPALPLPRTGVLPLVAWCVAVAGVWIAVTAAAPQLAPPINRAVDRAEALLGVELAPQERP